ncbi:MAG: beta-galactosidase [Lachnospiraceae bacterium]|nr:beta-galactosidase [Lachnospiraceae bacterium]
MRIGADYYPEHWGDDVLVQDVCRMKELGVDIVRMAEFAWSRLEPREGEYCFDWLDRAVQLFGEAGIDIVLCTPTCTPPQWMFQCYPQIIQSGADGQPVPIGVRGHRCMNSPVFRNFAEKIIRKMVSHYRDEPHVVAWQIDNELEANHCRCPFCQEAFKKWMEKKYTSVEEINSAYGNIVWSGEYSDMQEVKPPTAAVLQWQNPSLTLDFNRYASDSTVDYVRFQQKIIREIAPDISVTTNNWLCENMPDFYDMFRDLDFVSYDNYPPVTLPEDKETLYSHAFHLDLMRGIKRQNFWIMEELSGALGSWMPMSPTPRPGMLKGYSAQAFAHGADAVLHFRWRTGCSGAEMYWHGILDHSNVPGRRYEEFADLCRWVKQWKEIEGSVVINRVALLYGSDQEYAFKLQHQAEGMYYMEQLKLLHDAFTAIGVGVDIIDEREALEGYDIVLAPNLHITKEAVTKKLYRYVEQGGRLLLTTRSGVKDSFNKCIMASLPTVFAELVGVRVTEYDVIGETTQTIQITDGAWQQAFEQTRELQWNGVDVVVTGSRWCDLLETDTADVLAEYGEEFYKGTPAVTENRYKKGVAYYVGTVLNRSAYISLAKRMAEECGLPYWEDLPLGVEVTKRVRDGKEWLFVFNNTMESKKIRTGECLQPFEMKVLL